MLHADILLTLYEYLCHVYDYMMIVFPVLHFLRLTLHKPERGSRDPNITHFPSFVTYIASFLNMMLHPLSHNCPTEMREF
jgi:hypothetical protein